MTLYNGIAIGVGLLGFLFAMPAPETECPPPGITLDGTVVRVIDGDTVVVRSCVEYHVRLIDCWAPESRTTDPEEKARGMKSKARMQELATGRSVRVHMPGSRDVTDMVTLGRLLGRVWLMDGGKPQSADLSEIMVREKLATVKKPDAEANE